MALRLAVAVVGTGATAATEAPLSRPFPFLYDIGGGGNASQLQWVHTLVPRVELGKIFECPHPCGLYPSFDASTGAIVNGGVPQSPDFNMTLHLTTLQQTFDRGSAAHHSHKTIADIFELQIVAVSKVWARRLRAGKSRLWPA